MLNLHHRSIISAALVSLCPLALAQNPGDLAAEGTPAITVARGAEGAQGRALAQPGRTRAEVKEELARAIASGELDARRELAGEGTPVVFARMPFGAQGRAFTAPGLSRAEVMAEYYRARASGELSRMAEGSGGGN